MEIKAGNIFYICTYALEGIFKVLKVTPDKITVKFKSYDGEHKATTHKVRKSPNGTYYIYKYRTLVWFDNYHIFRGEW